ncbi:hypothetical protein JVT61DRAFT_12098 [Boletus reticuloceps]|uniref:Uncharacterized protein n=1 Tax=Boletus reticuloceps TaxID=495285 RepID=A0A8I2YEI9_9AGAM|nr:hypothetical protein JVT61DRAFT_12098 [Boletus reticuloceps]
MDIQKPREVVHRAKLDSTTKNWFGLTPATSDCGLIIGSLLALGNQDPWKIGAFGVSGYHMPLSRTMLECKSFLGFFSVFSVTEIHVSSGGRMLAHLLGFHSHATSGKKIGFWWDEGNQV